MPRKEKRGRPIDYGIKQRVINLRDLEDYSFSEIAKETGLGNKSNAKYHYDSGLELGLRAVDK